MSDMSMRLHLQLVDQVSAAMGKISQSTQFNTKALKANRDQLRALEKSVGLIQKLKKEQEALKHASAELKKNQLNLNALKQSGSASAAQIKAHTALVDKSTIAFNKQKQKLFELRSLANNSGIKNLAADEKRLANEIKNTTQLINQQDASLRRMDQLREQRNQGLMRAGAMGAAGMGMRMMGQRGLRASSSILSAGLGFDASMASLSGQLNLTGNSADMARLRELVLSQFTKNAEDMTGGISAMAQMGFNIDQIIAGMPMMLQAADAAQMSISDTATSFAGTMKGFQIDFSQFAHISDILVGASNAGNISIEQLNTTLEGVSQNANAAGLSIEHTAAMIGAMNRAGISADDAGTALNTVLRNMQSPSNDKALAALGIKPGQTSIMGLLQSISEKTAGMSDLRTLEHMSNIFGAKNAAAMTQLMNQMRSGGLDSIMEQINASQGATAARAAANTDSLKNGADDLTTTFTNLKVLIVDMNKEWLKELFAMLIRILGSIHAWVKENPQLVKTLSQIFVGISALLSVGGSLLMTLAAIRASTVIFRFGLGMLGVKFNGLLPIIANIGKAMWGLGVSMLTNPLFWAIAALAAAAYLIYKNWDSFVWFFEDLWDQIKTAFDGGIAGVSAFILNWSPLGLFYKAFAVVMDYFGTTLPENFTGFGEMIMNGLIEGIKNGLGWVKDAVMNVGDSVLGWFKDKLSINSPSRVFATAALSIPEGTALGITRGLPMVEDASLRLVRETQQGLPRFDGSRFVTPNGSISIDSRKPMSPSAGSQPATIGGDTIHIHLSGNGTNEEALMQRLMSILEERDRMKQARARSTFNDR